MSEEIPASVASTIQLIDTHCHIHEADPAYDDATESRERWLKAGVHGADELVHEATDQGVVGIICIGTTLADSAHAVQFAGRHNTVWASIGLHPHEADDYAGNTLQLQAFADLASKSKVVAVGECGLDYYYGHSTKQNQQAVLRFQLELAQAHDLAMSFHVRESFDDFWPIFDTYHAKKPIRGVLHSYTDNYTNLQKAVERGLYIGVNGIATFNKDPELQRVHREIPNERILLETDAPFLTPAPYRGTVCTPKHVVATAEFLSRHRNDSLEGLARTTLFNSKELFGIEP